MREIGFASLVSFRNFECIAVSLISFLTRCAAEVWFPCLFEGFCCITVLHWCYCYKPEYVAAAYCSGSLGTCVYFVNCSVLVALNFSFFRIYFFSDALITLS